MQNVQLQKTDDCKRLMTTNSKNLTPHRVIAYNHVPLAVVSKAVIADCSNKAVIYCHQKVVEYFRYLVPVTISGSCKVGTGDSSNVKMRFGN